MKSLATAHFKNCLGVFQGGGCKGLAFVGAYGEAYDRGVFFSRVSGTSAGSIVAALIAAGATPEQLESIVGSVDFKTFKGGAEAKLFSYKKSLLIRMGMLSEKGRWLARLGMYSSENLEKWLDQHLRSLLGKSDQSPVKFSELNIPLFVIATQLGRAGPKIWSEEETPDDSVAFAVRCSCSIPGFFQPVNGTYVDGGVLSNLPAFAIGSKSAEGFEKILCFTFSSNSSQSPPQRYPPNISLSPVQYLSELASAVVDGAVAVQAGLQHNLHSIVIGNLPLGTTDFDKINEESIIKMFSAGRSAARSFFDEEALHVKPAPPARRVLATESATLNELARYEVSADDQIIVLRSSNRWVYNLFPTLYYWSQYSARLTFVRASGAPAAHGKDERFRDIILGGLGAEVRASKDLPFEAVLRVRKGVAVNALIMARNLDSSSGFASSYDGRVDEVALQLMLEAVQVVVNEAAIISSSHDAAVEAFQPDNRDILERLKKVDQYSGEEITFSLEEVDTSRIVFLTRYVKSYKYTQIKHIFSIAKKAGCRPGTDLWLDYCGTDGKSFIMPVTPPVLEQHGENFVLIEGNSRVTYSMRELRDLTILAIVVRGVTAPIPATSRFSSKQVVISDEDRVGDTRYEGFDYSVYRQIESASRPIDSYIE